MAAGHGDRRDGFRAQFIGKLAKLVAGQTAQIRRHLHGVQQRGGRAIGHWQPLLAHGESLQDDGPVS